MSNKIELYTYFYKDAPIIAKKPYIPIMAGNANLNCTNMIGDDSGVNISDRNKYFSELTGIYWVWKNTKQDIVGSVHYRRFFTCYDEPLAYRLKRLSYYLAGIRKKRFGLTYTNNVKFFKDRILSTKELNDLLERYDLILPQRRKLKYTVEVHYKRYHDINDLKILKEILAEKSPEYLPSFEQVLAQKRLYANNMFIMRRADFDNCMEWLFDILFEFDKRVGFSNYKDYQERIGGFLAERLFNVWFVHSQLKIKELPVIYFKHFK